MEKKIIKLDEVKLPYDDLTLSEDELLIVKGGFTEMMEGFGINCNCGCAANSEPGFAGANCNCRCACATDS